MLHRYTINPKVCYITILNKESIFEKVPKSYYKNYNHKIQICKHELWTDNKYRYEYGIYLMNIDCEDTKN